MFTKIRLKNFRSFGDIEFDLTLKNGTPKNFAVIFGENGAGKSNLISAFVFLHEIVSTMDVRDWYEEILTKQAIYIDKELENLRIQRLKEGLRDIQAIINDYKMIGSDEPITAEYEFQLDGNDGKYSITLGKSEIIHEKLEFLLNKRKGIYFDCSENSISINSNIVKNKELLHDIKASAKRFWGKHSLISIVLHEIFDKSNAYVLNNIIDNFNSVLTILTINSYYLIAGKRKWAVLCSDIEVFESAPYGEIEIAKENELNIAENIFTQFFSAINSDIKRAYYDRTYNDKKIRYKLFFEKLVASQYRQIPYSKESTGNQQLLKVLCYILSAAQGKVVAIDEADSGIHDYLFFKILQEVIPYIKGQLIITTHNTMLMETEFSRNSTYILKEEEPGCKVLKTIADFDKRTYASNNIRNKYINNEYGGLPNVTAIDFKKLLEEVNIAIEE